MLEAKQAVSSWYAVHKMRILRVSKMLQELLGVHLVDITICILVVVSSARGWRECVKNKSALH